MDLARTYVLERHLDVAHKALWRAAQEADVVGDFGMYEDISECLLVVETLVRACVRRGGVLRSRPRDRAYLSPFQPDDGSPPT